MKKKHSILLLFCVYFSLSIVAQARFVLSGVVYVNIDNNAKLVIENPSTSSISSSGGGIITESEFDQVVWKVGTGTGAYVIPFTSGVTFTSIPFTAQINSAGVGSGEIRFSTYPGANWDNNTYRPSDVTHMFDYLSGTVNNSNHVIDRFWIIDALGYSTKPNTIFTFTYRDSEHLQVGNSIVELSLGAQRFNSSTNHWGDYLPQGSTNGVTNTTSGVPVIPTDFFRSWTLSEVTNPLAVNLNYFKSVCVDNEVNLQWQTNYESNVDHFEIHFNDGNGTQNLTSIDANGSFGINNYNYSPSFLYREGIFHLIEVDNNNNSNLLSTISVNCNNTISEWIFYNNINQSIELNFEGNENGIESLNLYDATGKLIYTVDLEIKPGKNTISIPEIYLSTGIYMVQFKNGQSFINKKLSIY